MLTVVIPLARRVGWRRATQVIFLCVTFFVFFFALTHEEACSVRALLETPLRAARRDSVNSHLLPYTDGYVESVFKAPAAMRRNITTQFDRLMGVQRSLECAMRLLRTYGESRWWIVGGSLVGSMRHGAPLPHDTDADFIIDEQDWERFIHTVRRLNRFDAPYFFSADERLEWRRKARRLVWYCDGQCALLRGDDDVLVGSVIDIGSGFYSDIWVGNVTDTEFVWWEYDAIHHLPLDRVFPLRNVSYYPLVNVQVPNDIGAYLSQSFSGDYHHYGSSAILFALFTRLPSAGLLRVLLLLFAARLLLAQNPFVGSFDRYVSYAQLCALLSIFIASVVSECAGTIALASLFASLAHITAHPPLRVNWFLDVPCILIFLLSLYTLRTWLARVYGCSGATMGWPVFAIDYASFWNGTNALA